VRVNATMFGYGLGVLFVAAIGAMAAHGVHKERERAVQWLKDNECRRTGYTAEGQAIYSCRDGQVWSHRDVMAASNP
jgi:hypothetical protein